MNDLSKGTTASKARLSMGALVAFIVLLAMSVCLLSLPGGYWPWYTIMATVAAVSIVCGPREFRRLGILALLVSVGLIAVDGIQGIRHRAWQREQRATRQPAIDGVSEMESPSAVQRDRRSDTSR